MSDDLGPETRARNTAVRDCKDKGIPWDSLSAYEQLDLINAAYDQDMIERGLDPLVDD